MGNRLAVSVPSQILPIEYYLKDIPDVQFKTSLGNTCFLKVACCSSSEGSVVVKVFVNHESSDKLEPYCDLLHRVHSHLDNAAPNCLMYASVKITDGAGIMLRQHVDSSLYERISTRPFLSHLEKTWLAFQLLCALRQTHQAQVYHGDVKSENVLVTGCGWLQLADFAPFKPVMLPDNDPSDFTYYFDTSRRRTCYIAPERFLRCDGDARDSSPESATSSTGGGDAGGGGAAGLGGGVGERGSSPVLLQGCTVYRTLNAAMDVFSAGCILVELFTEGYVPFNLTQLLAYRKDNYHPQHLIDKIEDPHIQALVLSMLSRDPAGRRSAGDYLEQQRGLAFPEYFYSFLWPYAKQFAGHPKRPPDVTIKQISESMNEILLNIGGEKVAAADKVYWDRRTNTTTNGSRCGYTGGSSSWLGKKAGGDFTAGPSDGILSDCCYAAAAIDVDCDSDCSATENDGVQIERCEALVLVLPIITSAYRGAKLCSSKLLGLETLMRVSRFCPDNIILDRILPAMLTGFESPESSVRACAVSCVTKSLTLVCSIPKQDACIFPEYIVPGFYKLATDSSVLVRQAVARNVATIADTAQRFLDWCFYHRYFSNRGYDMELKALLESLQSVVMLMCMDSSNVVKRTFMQHTQGHLWTFFGFDKANDIIIKHLITYLNDMNDHQLRRDFFDCLRNNAVMIGPYQGDIILPLLQQGMNDGEEWVVLSSIGALIAMTQLDIYVERQLMALIETTAPMLLHPNAVIRQSVVHLLCGLCQQLHPVDVLAIVSKLLAPFLLADYALDYTNQLSVLGALGPHLPRQVWRLITRYPDESRIFLRLRDALHHPPDTSFKQMLESGMPSSKPADDKLLRQLLSLGLDEAMAGRLLLMERLIFGAHGHRRTSAPGSPMGGSQDDRGEIQISALELEGGRAPEVFRYNLAALAAAQPASGQRVSGGGGGGGVVTLGSSPSLKGGSASSPGVGAFMVSPSAASSVTGGAEGSPASSSTPGSSSRQTAQLPSDRISLVPECELDAQRVVSDRCRQHINNRASRARLSQQPGLHGAQGAGGKTGGGGGGGRVSPSPVWEPEGQLISHLHEHSARVHRLCVVEGSSLFVSGSQDGTVRIWDANKTDREFPINRSRSVYSRLGAPVRCLAACHTQQSVAAAASNGHIHVFRLDKLGMQADRILDKHEDVHAVDMAFYDTGCGESVVVYGTVTAGVVGWDLRQPGAAWKFNNGPKNGLITSLMMDRDSYLLGVATNKGCITCWDIRFQLPIAIINHENGNHIRRLVKNPCDSRTAFAAVTGNNEVGLWELDTNYRRQTLWASPKEPLNHKEASSKSINGLCVGQCGGGGEGDVFVVTGGSDCCLRYWNLQQPANSRVLAHAAIDHPNYPDASFREVPHQETGSTVIVEERQPCSVQHRREHRGSSASSASGAGHTAPGGAGGLSSGPWLSASNTAELYDPHRPPSGHRDTITDIVAVDLPQRLLVSADAMGIIKIWK